MDDIDLAQQHDEMYRQQALKAHFAGRPHTLLEECRRPGPSPEGAGPGRRRCRRCGEEIEPERLEAVPEATLCVDCQRTHERGRRHG